MRARAWANERQRIPVLLSTLLVLASLMIGGARSQEGSKDASAGQIVISKIGGAIGVASALHTCTVIANAATEDKQLVVLQMDTPGGLLEATRDLIHCILAARRPVAVYVAPSGARAASAGTYIAYAAHITAMAPSTHIGAATPIALGPTGPRDPLQKKPDNETTPQPQQGAEQKSVNDAVAYLKALGELRGRNTEWAEKAVREAATLTSSEALRDKVIDVIATDIDDLLRQIDGRSVTIAGQQRVLQTAGARYTAVEPSWRLKLLAVISDPNIAFILLMVGVYGILFEFWSPGSIVPGTVGAISLLLGLTALSVLPLSYGALGLVLLGMGLMIAEAFVAGFGILGLGGLVAFIAGALFLFDPAGADFDLRLAWPVIIGTALTSALFSAIVVAAVLRARRMKRVTGAEEMIGVTGEVVHWQNGEGSVHVHGEIWTARATAQDAAALAPGDRIRVIAREGLTLAVEPAPPNIGALK